MSTIAIVGAGPGLGLAIARTFGRQGFDVALISRNQSKLDDYVAQLAEENITAAAFPADVFDRDALKQALANATARFGGIDVLEYSPVGSAAGSRLTSPSESTPDDVQQQIEAQLYGSIAATQAVLPAMREAGAGTLLFTTGAGSIDPVPFIANVNAAAAALRNWVINLNKELTGTGVYAAHMAINVSIDGAIPDFPAAPAAEVAAAYWELHQARTEPEHVFSA
jgi:NADP-dependent 3-hydroxy acid dehydrogenase YdfG